MYSIPARCRDNCTQHVAECVLAPSRTQKSKHIYALLLSAHTHTSQRHHHSDTDAAGDAVKVQLPYLTQCKAHLRCTYIIINTCTICWCTYARAQLSLFHMHLVFCLFVCVVVGARDARTRLLMLQSMMGHLCIHKYTQTHMYRAWYVRARNTCGSNFHCARSGFLSLDM